MKDFGNAIEFLSKCKLKHSSLKLSLYLIYQLLNTNINQFNIVQKRLSKIIGVNAPELSRAITELKNLDIIEKVKGEASDYYRFKPYSEWIFISAEMSKEEREDRINNKDKRHNFSEYITRGLDSRNSEQTKRRPIFK